MLLVHLDVYKVQRNNNTLLNELSKTAVVGVCKCRLNVVLHRANPIPTSALTVPYKNVKRYWKWHKLTFNNFKFDREHCECASIGGHRKIVKTEAKSLLIYVHVHMYIFNWLTYYKIKSHYSFYNYIYRTHTKTKVVESGPSL